MLMYHAYAVRDRVSGDVMFILLSLQNDLAAVLMVQPVQNIHQRRFARPILTQQCVDLPWIYIQIDMI